MKHEYEDVAHKLSWFFIPKTNDSIRKEILISIKKRNFCNVFNLREYRQPVDTCHSMRDVSRDAILQPDDFAEIYDHIYIHIHVSIHTQHTVIPMPAYGLHYSTHLYSEIFTAKSWLLTSTDSWILDLLCHVQNIIL